MYSDHCFPSPPPPRSSHTFFTSLFGKQNNRTKRNLKKVSKKAQETDTNKTYRNTKLEIIMHKQDGRTKKKKKRLNKVI